MTTFAERNYLDDWLKHEADGDYSRSIGVLDTGALKSGTVLGQILTAGATVAAKAGGNTGQGVLTVDVTDPVLSGAEPGDYRVTCIAAALGGGTFEVFAPSGESLGTVLVGATFANRIKFAIADGDPDFIVGDGFVVTATDGSGKWVQFDQDATTGAEIAAGILVEDADATAADVDAVILRRHAIVMPDNLIWPDDIEADEKALALANLAAVGILSDRAGA